MVTTEAWIVGGGGENVTGHILSEDDKQRIAVVSIIMICTIVGNLTLIFALTCKRSRRIKRVNVFLINLAIGDLAVAFFTNTTEIFFLAFGDWALGPAACKISVYTQIVTLASATFLLTAMSIDRYQVIVKPMQSLARRPRICRKVAVAWVMAFIFATPQLFIFLQVTKMVDGKPERHCLSKGYTAEWQRKVYMSFLTLYILLIPMAIMLYCYVNIIHVVWIRARADDRHDLKSSAPNGCSVEEAAGSPRMSVRHGLVTASKRRVITMTLTVIVGFLVCQTPYFIVSLVRIYSDYRIKLLPALAVSENLVLMHSSLNPVLYGLFTLRQHHVTALLSFFNCRSRSASASASSSAAAHAGERRYLLNGKSDGTCKAIKPRAGAPPRRDIGVDGGTVRKMHGVASKVLCSEETLRQATYRRKEETDKETGAAHRDQGLQCPNGTNLPLLLIANKAAVSAAAEEDRSSTSTAIEAPAKAVVVVAASPGRSSLVSSEASAAGVPAQWTPTCLSSNSEHHSCV
ncbi:neuropeptide S receptor-like [Pomacea canaliculata]|uniref:neuropeptide S receptor-like n=1 Tax=Pomacea canaliculata TaxID=400727 RepID=UPI000D72B441|nr:neuropeptide S receptor-like [Pomacea canaliculata]XP_025083952.1 neuropeptide S receptor-like [Pomacea canaliculata]